MVITVCQMSARHAALSGVCGAQWLERLHQMSGDFICWAQTLSRVLHVEIAEGHVIEPR